MMLRKYVALLCLLSASSVQAADNCQVTIERFHDVAQGYQVEDNVDGERSSVAPNPPLRCAEITITSTFRKEKIAIWLREHIEATLIDGREVTATQLNFKKDDVKAGYITFRPQQAVWAYVCFGQDATPIASIECELD
ncbi:hypothetical protein BOO91_02600 [Vibrio navarrensis]|nr:hypothetical protein UF06_16265 [Vibrio sp. S234-5]MBE3654540.1 hypothetical protein [Vibrio navarrensis]MBE3655185.1 hypothetical protein [Vibrio navarrensis]MBE3659839.1 hypothetical protein [Vibrio navarrensis]MBE4603945.1 hypothetical protein [Vibrio navarrensis]